MSLLERLREKILQNKYPLCSFDVYESFGTAMNIR